MGIINSRPGFKERKNKHLSEIFAGTGNPFYGKTHNPDAIEKMKTSWTIRDTSYLLRPEITSRYGSPGSKNGMYGKSIFEVWTQKYGTEMALQKMASLKQKLSIIFSGENNPMYGKTPPHGSGCGWSGWYKGWFFRSLRELSYVISVLEKDGHTWISAEHGILIRYVDEQGKTRTYRPDFLVDNKLLVEVKPQKLMATARNSIKANAAIEFCKLKGLEYQVTDVEIATNRIIELYKEGAIVFTDKYRKVIDEMIAKYEKPNPLPNRLPLLTAVL